MSSDPWADLGRCAVDPSPPCALCPWVTVRHVEHVILCREGQPRGLLGGCADRPCKCTYKITQSTGCAVTSRQWPHVAVTASRTMMPCSLHPCLAPSGQRPRAPPSRPGQPQCLPPRPCLASSLEAVPGPLCSAGMTTIPTSLPDKSGREPLGSLLTTGKDPALCRFAGAFGG